MRLSAYKSAQMLISRPAFVVVSLVAIEAKLPLWSALAFLHLPHPGTHGFRAFMSSSEYYRGISLSGQVIRCEKSSNTVSPSHPTLSKNRHLLPRHRVGYGHDPQCQLPSS